MAQAHARIGGRQSGRNRTRSQKKPQFAAVDCRFGLVNAGGRRERIFAAMKGFGRPCAALQSTEQSRPLHNLGHHLACPRKHVCFGYHERARLPALGAHRPRLCAVPAARSSPPPPVASRRSLRLSTRSTRATGGTPTTPVILSHRPHPPADISVARAGTTSRASHRPRVRPLPPLTRSDGDRRRSARRRSAPTAALAFSKKRSKSSKRSPQRVCPRSHANPPTGRGPELREANHAVIILVDREDESGQRPGR